MSKIWYTSDTHYFHRNIAGPKVSNWSRGYRDFENEEEMSRHIVKVFNQTVAEDDILYHLGDWSFGSLKNIWNFRKQLRCQNIHLILGNHDTHIEKDKILPNCHRQEIDDVSMSDILNDAPKDGMWFQFEVNAKEPFSSVQQVLDVSHGSHKFFLSHYAHRVWKASHKGVIHLYGHSHGNLEKESHGKSMDVGIDNAKRLLGEYRPFSVEEVINLMNKRDTKFIDHHSKNTNI